MENSSLSVSHKISEPQHTNSLSGWANAYLALVVNGSSPATYEAKKRDLQLFLRFSENVGIGGPSSFIGTGAVKIISSRDAQHL